MQDAMTELLAEFGCDAAQGRVMDAAELREQADMVAEQQAEVLKEKLAAERPVPEETLSFYVAECLEFTFAGEFHDHLTMEEALEAYDKIPSERMNADKCIGFCIEEDGGFVGMYELVVNDKVQRENINSINYFRDDKLVQQAISDMEKLMAARQQSKEQERGSTKKSVLDALRSLKAKKQEQPAQEQDKPKKAKKKGIVHQIKNSLAPTAEDIRFSISADKGFQWLECRPQSFENQKPDRKPEFESEQQKAVYWIKHFLEKGDMSANEIYCRLDNEGVSKRVARMVKTEMGIHCYQKKRRWYWSAQPEEGAVNGPQV